ncbi:hypothetical protein SAMN04488020_11834 [Palleronia marisminoris]|uniref:Pectate lyase superfamily protein n=1 Tax=Palleronia marisminoris TaxID=315423 RepID=A0A1Y5TXK0_9RHOB|nr:hypothetical protein [Palleronia marisminoris]SFH50394.1 hypothetical protein SAMN04488020_11834 [Palleronia marisminoris]SLN70414.1 Pectate lyase superfamily protein [Palleronia marisminoris]
MPLPTATVTGTFSFADGKFLDDASVIFRLAGSGTDVKGLDRAERGIVVTEPIEVKAQFDRFEVELWPNARGIAPTHYVVTLQYTLSGKQFTRPLGVITVPENGGDLTDLLMVGANTKVVGSIVSLLSQDEYDAAILAKSDAQAALTEARVIQGEMNTKLPAPINGVLADTETPQTQKNKTISRADNHLRMSDDEPDHRVKTFAGMSGMASKTATGELIRQEDLRFLYERVATADNETFEVNGAHYRPVITLVHKIDLGAYQPDMTGETDSSAAMNKAIAAATRLGGGTIVVPRGILKIGNIRIPRNIPIRIEGGGWSRYTVPAFKTGVTRIIPTDDCDYIFLADYTYAFQLANMDFVGRGRTVNHAVILNKGAKRNFLHNIRGEEFAKFNDLTYDFAARSDTDPANMFVLDCVLRKFQNAIYKMVDGDIVETTLAGCTTAAIVIDSGQCRVANCFFEFNRGGAHLDTAADDIHILQNAREPFIYGNTSDRTSGRFVRIFTFNNGTEIKAPENVFISGNTIKRCAWARLDYNGSTPWGPKDRYAIVVEGPGRGRSLFFGSNNVQTADSSPTPAKGPVSPLGFLKASDGELVVKGLHGTLASYVDIDTMRRYRWVLTGAGTSEYALIDNMQWPSDYPTVAYDPGIEKPDQVLIPTGVLTAAMPGSLAEGQYAFAPLVYEGSTFTTLHVRMPGGSFPKGKGVRPWYDVQPIVIGNGSLETDDYLCCVPTYYMGGGSSRTHRLRLNRPLSTVRERRLLNMVLTAHMAGAPSEDGLAEVRLLARADFDGAGTITVASNTPVISDVTVGGTGAGADLEFAITRVTPFCEEFNLTITNTTTRNVKVSVGLSA